MLTILTFRWGNKYSADHVRKLASMVKRNLKCEHRFLCVTNEPIEGIETTCLKDPGLTKHLDGCWARLRMFEPNWQREIGAESIVCLDLDLVITGELDPLFDQATPFKIAGRLHFNPCVYNGSLMQIKSDAHPEVWDAFNVQKALDVAHADGTNRGTDQTWIAHMIKDAPTWGPDDGVYAFRKPPIWTKDDSLPKDARVVAFPGAKDPSQLTHLPWIEQHWR